MIRVYASQNSESVTDSFVWLYNIILKAYMFNLPNECRLIGIEQEFYDWFKWI